MQLNKIKIGDTVRFLNSTGGGLVTNIDTKKGLIYVEDEDGFEVPVLETECVVVPKVNMETNFPVKDFSKKPEVQIVQDIGQKIKIEESEPIEIIETAEGDKLQAFLAFIPNNIKNLSVSTFDCVLVNDSNYFLFYNLIIGDSGQRKSVANGIIEPNIQEDLATIVNTELNDWENLQVQIIPYKKDKIYEYQSAIDINLRIAPLKLYKLHSFTENEYFEEPALLFELKNPQETLYAEISADDIKKAMFQKEPYNKPNLHKEKSKPNAEKIEVDLHINELLDNTSGLSNADMLKVQIDKFKSTLEENKRRKGQKIVFIHGKGEGILRNEIVKLLKTQYKSYQYQDASFREYGFGATMVTIR